MLAVLHASASIGVLHNGSPAPVTHASAASALSRRALVASALGFAASPASAFDLPQLPSLPDLSSVALPDMSAVSLPSIPPLALPDLGGGTSPVAQAAPDADRNARYEKMMAVRKQRMQMEQMARSRDYAQRQAQVGTMSFGSTVMVPAEAPLEMQAPYPFQLTAPTADPPAAAGMPPAAAETPPAAAEVPPSSAAASVEDTNSRMRILELELELEKLKRQRGE